MLRFSLRQLEYFVAAAQHGSTARAAEALAVSQPSVSRAIAELEDLWQEPLFVRLHARGLELTAAGISRHREAHALLERARAMHRARPAGRPSGLLRVGCLSTFAPRWMPAILARLRRSHPGIEVRLHEGDTEALMRMLERGALDAALLYDLVLGRPGVRLEPVASLLPHALLPWGHRLAAGSSLRLADLAREPLVLIDLPHSREYFLSLFRQAGVIPVIAWETGSLEMVRSLVANGLGVSLLTTRPAHAYSQDGGRLAVRRLRGRLAPQTIVLASPTAADFQSPLAAPLLQAARATIRAGAPASAQG